MRMFSSGRRRAVAAFLAVPVACLALIGTPPAQAAQATTPTVQTYFQTLPSGNAPEQVADTLESDALLGSVGPGWNLYLSMYNLVDNETKSHDVVDRLLNALYATHARLHVVLDEKNAPFGDAASTHQQKPGCPSNTDVHPNTHWTNAASRLYCIVQRDQTDVHVPGGAPGTFVRCEDGCLGRHSGGTDGIDHDKFLLLAGPQGQRIVASMSANWTPSQLADRYQTMTVVRDDLPLFRSVYAYWSRQNADSGNDHPTSNPTYGDNFDYPATGDALGIGVHYLPQTGNPDLAALRQVECSRGDIVDIASNGFDNDDLYRRVAAMQASNCTVRVLVSTPDPDSIEPSSTEPAAQMAAIGARCRRNLHRKDMVIDAHRIGGAVDRIVLTGSYPFQNGLSTSDNLILQLPSSSVAQFEAHFKSIWDLGHPWTTDGCS